MYMLIEITNNDQKVYFMNKNKKRSIILGFCRMFLIPSPPSLSNVSQPNKTHVIMLLK